MQRLFTTSTGLGSGPLELIVNRLVASERTRGRPWSRSLQQRAIIVCVALRTNLTIRELGEIFAISKSQIHRILVDLVPRMAALLAVNVDRRASWVLDGTLIPTRDHATAGKSKNYRWSCNVQVLIRRRDLRIICVAGGGPGNRNDVVHYRNSDVEALSRARSRARRWWLSRASRSVSRRDFEAAVSFATPPGGDIDVDELASNTRSQDSRIGACFAITDAEGAISSTRFERSPYFTMSASNCGTTLSLQAGRTSAARRSALPRRSRC
jgi:hypothetical protein